MLQERQGTRTVPAAVPRHRTSQISYSTTTGSCAGIRSTTCRTRATPGQQKTRPRILLWRHDGDIASLIHINGLPGLGKSSLAEELAKRHPLALVVDIDLLRTQLGEWQERPESKLVARDLAIALIETHLEQGRDVIVPQFLGRVDFIERLELVASAAGARFVEVMLTGEPASAVERFRERRERLAGRPHPENDISDSEVESTIAAAADALANVSHRRSRVHRVAASGDVNDTCSALLAAIGEFLG